MNPSQTKAGVLRREFLTGVFRRKAEASPQSATARPAIILESHCLAHQRSFCSVCVERCPERGAVVVTLGKPRIDPARCTGCGLCADACPAPQGGAIAVIRSQTHFPRSHERGVRT
jgi:Pyruvate/2-oxoacid:ferredoxin oxidoreductase delta subunit